MTAASQSVCASMKTKVDSTIAFRPMRCGTTASNCGLCSQRIRNERQNSSSITGTSKVAPIQRSTISGQISAPAASVGTKLALGSPMRIHGASSTTHRPPTAIPTPIPSATSEPLGNVCGTSSPYSRQNHASAAPTTRTATP
jgi:hypothetical protein